MILGLLMFRHEGSAGTATLSLGTVNGRCGCPENTLEATKRMGWCASCRAYVQSISQISFFTDQIW